MTSGVARLLTVPDWNIFWQQNLERLKDLLESGALPVAGAHEATPYRNGQHAEGLGVHVPQTLEEPMGP